MKYPKKLRIGDTIGLVAPSSAVSEERVEQSILALESLGFFVKAADNLSTDWHGLSAGPAKIRAEWVNRMFADPEVDAVFCIRGGDGSSRIMQYLDYDIIRKNPKIFVGYSDITNLHIGINQNCGFVTFHGPMVSSNIVDDFDQQTMMSLFRTLNADGSFPFANPKGCELEIYRKGKEGIARGELTGGNLSLIAATLATPFEIDTRDKVLFIEETGERVSMIEKYMMHLKNAGLFDRASAVLLGQFTHEKLNCAPDFDSIACLKDILGDLTIPVVFGVQSGHDHSVPMMTLPMGAECIVDTVKKEIRFAAER
ncbi:MAG: LD-carboxypeptidase [Lachnospiraceae bacterium]|nr:LD-carboxypeptidase [Lachnospiraceae bacterium]